MKPEELQEGDIITVDTIKGPKEYEVLSDPYSELLPQYIRVREVERGWKIALSCNDIVSVIRKPSIEELCTALEQIPL